MNRAGRVRLTGTGGFVRTYTRPRPLCGKGGASGPGHAVMPRKEPRDYADEYASYHGTAEQKRNRAARNNARREAIRTGKARKGDGTHVDHKDGNPRNNSKKNKRVVKSTTNLRKGTKPLH